MIYNNALISCFCWDSTTVRDPSDSINVHKHTESETMEFLVFTPLSTTEALIPAKGIMQHSLYSLHSLYYWLLY